jgi:predicted helicase
VYRPFTNKYYYSEKTFSDRLTEHHYKMFGLNLKFENKCILLTGTSSTKPFQTLCVDQVPGLDTLEKTQCLPLYRYNLEGDRIDNITNWALEKFRSEYNDSHSDTQEITKDAIFHYVYGVLHDPIYREKYSQNLKRDFPRIPFYPDFWQWAAWGEQLMALHIGYETQEPWPITRLDVPDERARANGVAPTPKLKSDPLAGIITLDSETQLTGIPKEAWEYRLGNRSALDWILDQHKEKTPKDPTIREKFNTYKFADYKEKVVDLIARVTRVSVETIAITTDMRELKRD